MPRNPRRPWARVGPPNRAAIEARLRDLQDELAGLGDELPEAEDVERRVALRAAIRELGWVLGMQAGEST